MIIFIFQQRERGEKKKKGRESGESRKATVGGGLHGVFSRYFFFINKHKKKKKKKKSFALPFCEVCRRSRVRRSEPQRVHGWTTLYLHAMEALKIHAMTKNNPRSVLNTFVSKKKKKQLLEFLDAIDEIQKSGKQKRVCI